jgi:hypothetical protein
VFVVSGACVAEVVNAGPLTSYGANDMVLDNWGRLAGGSRSIASLRAGRARSGFVNFGSLDNLSVRGALETHGTGAAGFNPYDGSLRHAHLESIRITGDGAVGIQVARELPEIEIDGDLTTSGGEGMSLVKGVQTKPTAIALSIQAGGHVGRVAIGGRTATLGDGVVTLDAVGVLEELRVDGGIAALGKGSQAVHANSEIRGLDTTRIETGGAARERPGRPERLRPER